MNNEFNPIINIQANEDNVYEYLVHRYPIIKEINQRYDECEDNLTIESAKGIQKLITENISHEVWQLRRTFLKLKYGRAILDLFTPTIRYNSGEVVHYYYDPRSIKQAITDIVNENRVDQILTYHIVESLERGERIPYVLDNLIAESLTRDTADFENIFNNLIYSPMLHERDESKYHFIDSIGSLRDATKELRKRSQKAKNDLRLHQKSPNDLELALNATKSKILLKYALNDFVRNEACALLYNYFNSAHLISELVNNFIRKNKGK